jgi:purine-binding chemotaxis protein CheW
MTEDTGQQKQGGKTFQIVSFTVGKEEYGVHIEAVQEIVRMPEITHLPQTQSFIKGVINLRGNIIPVIDMRERFRMEKKDYNEMTRVIVVKIGEKLVGMIVDTVSQVLEMGANDVEDAPDIISGLSKEYIEGIGKINEQMIIVLKIEKVLTSEELSSLEKID